MHNLTHEQLLASSMPDDLKSTLIGIMEANDMWRSLMSNTPKIPGEPSGSRETVRKKRQLPFSPAARLGLTCYL